MIKGIDIISFHRAALHVLKVPFTTTYNTGTAIQGVTMGGSGKPLITDNQVVRDMAQKALKKHKNTDKARAELVAAGVPPIKAQVVLAEISKSNAAGGGGAGPSDSSGSGEGARHMLVGGLWFTGGVIATGVGYAAASGGGKYMVFYGAIAYGAIRFLYGVGASMKG